MFSFHECSSSWKHPSLWKTKVYVSLICLSQTSIQIFLRLSHFQKSITNHHFFPTVWIGGLNIDSEMNDKTNIKMELLKVIKTDNTKGKCGACYEIYKRKERKMRKKGKGGYTWHPTLLNPGVICDCFSIVNWHKKKLKKRTCINQSKNHTSFEVEEGEICVFSSCWKTGKSIKTVITIYLTVQTTQFFSIAYSAWKNK